MIINPSSPYVFNSAFTSIYEQYLCHCVIRFSKYLRKPSLYGVKGYKLNSFLIPHWHIIWIEVWLRIFGFLRHVFLTFVEFRKHLQVNFLLDGFKV